MTAPWKLSERGEGTAVAVDGFDSGGSVPVWAPGLAPKFRPSLQGDAECDVAIVGAGIVGLCTALLCKRAGSRVLLLDAREVAHGESLRTTAHVTAHLDARWTKIVDDRGAETAGLLWREAMGSIELLESLVRELNVACGWKRVPAWLWTEKATGVPALEAEAEAARSAGIPWTLHDSRAPVPWPIRAALQCEGQAQLDPAPLLDALADAVDGGGSRVLASTPALEVQDGDCPVVVTQYGVVRAQHVVVAAHAPFQNRLLLQTKLAQYRSYAIALDAPQALHDGLYWDDEDPYHYVRSAVVHGRRTVIVGGEDHRTGHHEDTTERLARLEDWAAGRLPGARRIAGWSGQILEPVDGLPYVGRNSLDHDVLTATGFSGTGYAYGVLAARMLTDAIHGRAHPLADVLAATRVTPLASAQRFVQENAQFPWHFFGGHLSPESTEIGELAPGTGRLFMARSLRKVAVYRDHDGRLHALSPICPHMGCVVDFNPLESSWDCPCHGSRFDVEGRLLNGPATKGLDPVEVSERRQPPAADAS